MIDPKPDMGGWSAEMRPASFILHAPLGSDGKPEHRFRRTGAAWSIERDEVAPILAVLRDATRWFCNVWQFSPENGYLFGISSGLTARHDATHVHLRAERWCAWAPSTHRLQLAYTDLQVLRYRLQCQQQSMRRAARRKGADDLHAHR